jgi:hypothetical protein
VESQYDNKDCPGLEIYIPNGWPGGEKGRRGEKEKKREGERILDDK